MERVLCNPSVPQELAGLPREWGQIGVSAVEKLSINSVSSLVYRIKGKSMLNLCRLVYLIEGKSMLIPSTLAIVFIGSSNKDW